MLLGISLFAILLSPCSGYPRFQDNIPNGTNVPNPCDGASGTWPGVGHVGQEGGGNRNVFGQVFV